MFLLEALGEPVWQRLTWTLLHFLWQGLAVAALVATLLCVWPVRRASHRYALCLAALIVMAVCPLVTFITIEAPEPGHEFVVTEIRMGPTGPAVRKSQPPLEGSSVALSPAVAPAIAPADEVPPDLEGAESLRVPATWETRLQQGVDTIQPYWLIAWMAGVLVLATRLSFGWLQVRWVVWGRRAVPADLAIRAAKLGRRLGLRFPPRIGVSEKIREAIVVGLWRPLVLMPASWLTEMTPEVLEAVIAHELAHIRRWDLWVNLLQRLVETLLFYHPAVWWLSRRVGLEREMCTDELAVGATSERLAYATALEQLGRMRLGRTASQFGAAIRGREMALLDRVSNVLGLSTSPRRARWWPVGLLAMVVPLAIWLASMSMVLPTKNEAQAKEVADDIGDRTETPEDQGRTASSERIQRGSETNTQEQPVQVLLDESHCFLFATHDGIIRYLRPRRFRLLSSYAALTALPLERFDVICTIVTGAEVPRYRPEEFALLDKVVRGGAGLLIMGGLGAPDSPVNRFARGFGFQFPPGAAEAPFRVSPHACFQGADVDYQVSDEGYPCRVRVEGEATPLVTDATGAPVIAVRRHGKGWVAGASLGGLVTHYHGGGKVDVNVELLRRVIAWLGQNHVADLSGPPIEVTAAVGTGIGPEKVINIDGFCLRYSAVVEPHCQFLIDNTPRIANEVFRLTGLRHPRRLGVILLPTGGAGYSSGSAGIAISAFGTPEAQAAVMAHELTNSIHPYGPLWWGDAGWSQLCNQRVVRALSGKPEKVAPVVSPAPDVDPFGWPKAGATAKLFWMVEQLEQKYGQDFIARHFRLAKKYLPRWTKRKWPDGNAPVVYWWSVAAGEDLFPWVQSMGGTASSVPVLTVVEETSPTEGARNVNPQGPLVVRLTAPMHADAPVFDVFGDIQGTIEGHVSVSADGKTVRFHPARPFAKGEQVCVRIHSSALRDKAGRALDGNGNAMLDSPGEDDYEFQFLAAGVAAYSIEGPAQYVEAEDYDLHTRRGSHSWDFRGWRDGVSGKGFLRGEPGWNAVFYEEDLDRSPSAVFNIQCEKAGRYYLWVRGRGEAGGASLWAILNDEVAAARSIGFFPGSFTWMSTGIKGGRAVFDIPHPGLHSIDFRILEDGVSFDTFVLTDDPDFKPGPVDSLPQAQRFSTDRTSNRPPTIVPLQPIQVQAGERVAFDVLADDPDGDLLEYSVQNLPQGAAFDRHVRVLSWTPKPSQVGSHRISFSVSDGEHEDSQSAVVEVLGQPWQTDFDRFLALLDDAATAADLEPALVGRQVRWKGTLKYFRKGRPYFKESFVRVNGKAKAAGIAGTSVTRVMYYTETGDREVWEEVKPGATVEYTGVISNVREATGIAKEPFVYVDLRQAKVVKWQPPATADDRAAEPKRSPEGGL